MNVIYVPQTATRLGETINLHYWMVYINRTIRLDNGASSSMKAIRCIGECSRCKQTHWTSSIEAHHKRPVWVFALESILKPNPQSIEDIHRVVHILLQPNSALWEFNLPTNLEPLCKQCHDQLHVTEDNQWKQFFESQYPVVFGQRRLRDIDILLAKNVTQVTAKVTL